MSRLEPLQNPAVEAVGSRVVTNLARSRLRTSAAGELIHHSRFVCLSRQRERHCHIRRNAVTAQFTAVVSDTQSSGTSGSHAVQLLIVKSTLQTLAAFIEALALECNSAMSAIISCSVSEFQLAMAQVVQVLCVCWVKLKACRLPF